MISLNIHIKKLISFLIINITLLLLQGTILSKYLLARQGTLFLEKNRSLIEVLNNQKNTLDGKSFSEFSPFINPESLDQTSFAFHILFNDLSQAIFLGDVDNLTPVPGGVGSFTEFIGCCGVGAAVSGETVIFYGEDSLGQPGIYTSTNGVTNVIIDTNTPIPGGTQNFTRFAIPTIDNGNVLFFGGGSSGQEGVYTIIDGFLNVVADTNMSVPGGVGNFTDFTPWFSLSNKKVAFQAVDSLGKAGIYTNLNGQVHVVADTNTVIPNSQEQFTDFLFSGHDISSETITFTGIGESISGVYTATNGQLNIIADTNTPIPDGKGNFIDFGTLSLDQNNVVFLGFGEENQKGYYTNLGGQLRTILDLNTPGVLDFSFLNGPSIKGETAVVVASAVPVPSSILGLVFIGGSLGLTLTGKLKHRYYNEQHKIM